MRTVLVDDIVIYSIDEGLCEGFRVGLFVGLSDGFREGVNVTEIEPYEGPTDGSSEDILDGSDVGLFVKALCDGCLVGLIDGLDVGLLLEGLFEGWYVGSNEGRDVVGAVVVGIGVIGEYDGVMLGEFVGSLVGPSVLPSLHNRFPDVAHSNSLDEILH